MNLIDHDEDPLVVPHLLPMPAIRAPTGLIAMMQRFDVGSSPFVVGPSENNLVNKSHVMISGRGDSYTLIFPSSPQETNRQGSDGLQATEFVLG
jgi:hypothetical protein